MYHVYIMLRGLFSSNGKVFTNFSSNFLCHVLLWVSDHVVGFVLWGFSSL